jgi:hypothetical protein
MIGGTILAPACQGQPALMQDPSRQSPGKPIRGAKATNPELLGKWFQAYDNIRRQAQMTPAEREKADTMMSQGLAVVIPGEQKVESQQLLSKLVHNYQVACTQLKALPFYPETGDLHKGYYQYFSDAGRLFSDYLRVQDNLFAVDEQTGKPLASQLMERKEALEALDQKNKYLDSQLRNRLGIAPYQY